MSIELIQRIALEGKHQNIFLSFQTDKDAKSPNQLQMLSVTYMSLADCKKFNPIIPKSPLHLVTDNNICTMSGPGQGECDGDSGGPLVSDGYQIGVLSFGPEPCGPDKPNAYTSVPIYKSWISQETGVHFP